MNKRYLITGVGGFVGRYFVEYLQKKEPDAIIFGVDIAPKIDMPIHYRAVDLANSKETDLLIADVRPDYIVHLAGVSSVGQSWSDPKFCFENNTSIMLNLLTVLNKNQCNSRVLSVGSSEEYGEYGAEQMPLIENMPLLPQNPYAVAKVSQELIGKLFNKSFAGVDVVMTRSFNHIGPRQNSKFVIPSFISQLVAISKGKQKKMTVGNIEVARDFTDVRDVVAAYYLLLQEGKSGEVYNVCSSKAYKLHDVITIAEQMLGIKANIVVDEKLLRPNDTPLVLGDNAKLRALGWKPEISIQQTIKDMIKG